MAKVLVVGKGGREDAISWKLSQSGHVDKIYIAPGNGGAFTENGRKEKIENVPIQSTHISQLLEFAKEQKIDLTVVGPEASLAVGIVDNFRKAGLNIFGPTSYAAQIESSKTFAKRIMAEMNIPTAKHRSFDSRGAACEYVVSSECNFPTVVKEDGIASGKGVRVCYNAVEAVEFIKSIPRGIILLVEQGH